MTKKTLTLYTNPMSRGRVVRWMLEEIGEPYNAVSMEFGPATQSEDFLALNPMGKLPVLTHGDAVVTETVAVCAYLADAFPQAKLAPPANDAEARAAYHRWLYFVAGPFESAIADKMLGVEDIPQDKQGFVGYGNYDKTVKTLEALVANKTYIAGDGFTTADLVMTAYLDFYMQWKVLPSLPAFVAYVDKHNNRPAAVRATKTDDALIEQNKAAG